MRLKHLFLMLCLFTISTSWASSQSQPPQKCPSVAAIIKDFFMFNDRGCYFDNTCHVTARGYHFDTTDTWDLIMWVNADGGYEASEKAKTSLSSITFSRGPVQLRNGNWVCIYDNSAGYKTHVVRISE